MYEGRIASVIDSALNAITLHNTLSRRDTMYKTKRPNKIEILHNGTVKMFLTKGQHTVMDAESYGLVKNQRWLASFKRGGWVCARGQYVNSRKTIHIYLHRLITECPPNMFVDHINHHTLDNRMCNLRICTNSENQMNAKCRTGSSIYKGVYYHKASRKWRARIRRGNKLLSLGSFNNERDAAEVYNLKAELLFGEFALLNEL